MRIAVIVSVVLMVLCLDSIAVPAQDLPSYKPPPRGAPGGRVGGASRGGTAAQAALIIETVSPDSHAGLTASASPTLYYFVSQAVTQPVTLSIRAPNQARPIVEASLTPPRGAGVYAISLATYRVQLQPGVQYTWSVSVSVDPKSPSSDVVASATMMRIAADPAVDAAVRAATPGRRAVIYAQAGLWYDAAAAAAEAENTDGRAAFNALLDQAGLGVAARYNRGR